MARQFVYVDSIIGSLAEQMDHLRKERGDLTDNNASVATVVYDVLNWIGLPDVAIQMVLGGDAEAIQGDATGTMPCAHCDAPAVGLVQCECGWRLVCSDCGSKYQES